MGFNLKNANILVIDISDQIYNALISSGFKNIVHIKSIINANKYFKEHLEELSEYDAVVFGADYTPGDNPWEKSSFFGDYCSEHRKVFMHVSYIPFNAKIGNESYNLHYWVWCGRDNLSEDSNFNYFGDDLEKALFWLDELSLKPITYKEPVVPKKDKSPSKFKDLKVLFCGHENYFEEVSKFLEKAHVKSISLTDANNYTFKEFFESLPLYDLVIADGLYCGAFTGNARFEISELLKNTSNPSITLITFKTFGHCYNTKAGSGSSQLYSCVAGNEASDVEKTEYDFYGTMYEQIESIIGTSLNLYADLNNFHDEKRFKGIEEYNAEAKKRSEMAVYWLDKKGKIEYMHNAISKYWTLFKNNKVSEVLGLPMNEVIHKKETKPFNFSNDKNYLVLTYMLLRVPLYSIHIPLVIEDNENIPIIIQTVDNKGSLSAPKEVIIKASIGSDVDYLSKEEDDAIQAIYNITKEKIIPILEDAQRPPANSGYVRGKKPHKDRRY